MRTFLIVLIKLSRIKNDDVINVLNFVYIFYDYS